MDKSAESRKYIKKIINCVVMDGLYMIRKISKFG